MKKKTIATLLTLAFAVSMIGCGQAKTEAPAETATEAESTEAADAAETEESVEETTEATEETAEETTEEAAEETTDDAAEESDAAEDTEAADDADAATGDVMSHDDFAAADLDAEVTVETYVQAKQGWWEKDGVGVATFYTQAEDGAYFLYNMPCSEEDYAKLEQGTKIKVTGYKTEWEGEVEIIDATYEIEDGNFVAEAEDVTADLASDSIIDHQNEFVSFTDMTVEASKDADGNEVAFLYNYDGSGSQGDDLYFNVSADGNTYTFTVESYLCDKDSDVYKAVEALNVGDKVDMEGFLYWYQGVNPHITKVTVK
ncbi:hypothetical protein [Butyrivibrio sp. WCD2001]|uniref:hypothetical protein n=1 Tax=Butyrivibrio sp. WCD2001 TaxID=1280681 RepID=UPI00040A6CF2|nr:hypothetical protein [Butyrivibrio sp. WCD2001]